MTITQLIKAAAGNGVISLERALKIAAHVDKEREQTVDILKKCAKNVGMMLGEDINAHLDGMQGTYFNERDYHYERPVGSSKPTSLTTIKEVGLINCQRGWVSARDVQRFPYPAFQHL